MRKTLSLLALTVFVSLPVVAGEVTMPPAPPKCTENCLISTQPVVTVSIPDRAILALIGAFGSLI